GGGGGEGGKAKNVSQFAVRAVGDDGPHPKKDGAKRQGGGGHEARTQRRGDAPPRRAGERRSRRERSRFGRPASTGADRRAQDLRARARRLARRLVLAARGRPSAKERAQGDHADDDGVGRPFAPRRPQG